MADTDKKPSLLMGTIVPILALTVVAAGGGAAIGMQVAAAIRAGANGAGAKPEAPATPAVATQAVKELAPIITNLSYPDGAWVRLQTAIVYDKNDLPQADAMAAKIGGDVLAFVKTLTMAQLQGASGLQNLREDLNERAVLRSEGRVRELMIEMLVVQ